MLRLFIAINLTTNPKNKIEEIIKSLNFTNIKINWTPKENLHITTHFLGNTDEKLITNIKTAIDKTLKQHSPLIITLDEINFFNIKSKSSILHLTTTIPETLIKLHSTLTDNLKSKGLKITERKDYRPHITLARIKNIRNVEAIEALTHKLKVKIPIEIDNITLFQSELSEKGAKHTKLYTGKLER